MNTADWLDTIHAYYCRQWVTPVAVAAELLLGLCDAETVAGSIAARGRRIGDDAMSATTPADVGDAMDELVALGFLGTVAELGSEALLELRMP